MHCALRHAVTTLIAVILPFFGDLLGFVGAIATGPTTFWLPPLMWLILKRPSISNVKPSLPLLLRGPMHASTLSHLAFVSLFQHSFAKLQPLFTA